MNCRRPFPRGRTELHTIGRSSGSGVILQRAPSHKTFSKSCKLPEIFTVAKVLLFVVLYSGGAAPDSNRVPYYAPQEACEATKVVCQMKAYPRGEQVSRLDTRIRRRRLPQLSLFLFCPRSLIFLATHITLVAFPERDLLREPGVIPGRPRRCKRRRGKA